MSRRASRLDNAVAESFFQLLRRDVFNYTELVCNPKRRHGSAGGVSLIEYEKNYYLSQQSV